MGVSASPHTLSENFLDSLDPVLRKMYLELPEAFCERIAKLVGKSGPTAIHPNRLVKFAFLHASAALQAEGDAVSADHARRSRSEIKGKLHGVDFGYHEEAQTTQRFNRGREARHQVGASLESVQKQWERCAK